MSNTILNLWSSGKIESRTLVVLLGSTNLFTAGLAISTWVASGRVLIPDSIRFYMIWTSFLVIATVVALTAFIVHIPMRTELVFGAVLTAAIVMGQVLLTWAVQYGGTTFTAVSVFAAFLVVTLHGSGAILWYSRQNLLPTIFKAENQLAATSANPLPASPA